MGKIEIALGQIFILMIKINNQDWEGYMVECNFSLNITIGI